MECATTSLDIELFYSLPVSFPPNQHAVLTFSLVKLYLLDSKANSSYYNNPKTSSNTFNFLKQKSYNFAFLLLFSSLFGILLICVSFVMGVHGKVRDRMEKFVVLPFSMGCVSQASVAVAQQRTKRKTDLQSPSLRIQEEEDDDESLCGESLKHSSRFMALPRPNLATGVNRLVKGFKSLSQLFIYEDEMEELGMDMEIGCPTDVKHVTHIGWDNIPNTDQLMGWDNIITTNSAESAVNLEQCLKQFKTTAPENDSSTLYH